MEIYIYQAECGDAARISYMGLDNQPHNIFIDSGYERTYQNVLYEEIQKIEKSGENIDLWIISHIHSDHIGGALAYIKGIQYGEMRDIVRSWYYNTPRLNKSSNEQVSVAKSIKQGDALATYLSYKGKLLGNDISTELPVQDLFGLKITILSPDTTKLKALREKYTKSPEKPLEYDEFLSISKPSAAKNHDYNTRIENFVLDNWQEDESIENGSSISFFIEYNNKKILWLSDSHPSTVIESLNRMGYSKDNPFECDWVKVTHHGSKANNSSELYESIRCSNYILSANGENRDYLPSKECIVRILRNSNRDLTSKYNFYFTYDNEVLRNIFKIDGDKVFKKWNFELHFQEQSKWIKFPDKVI